MRETLAQYAVRMGREDLLREWEPMQNGSDTPETVSYGSRKKITWRCKRGHTWKTAVYQRTGAESGCPYCIGKKVIPGENDLASVFPEIAAEWDQRKNGTLTPESVLAYSNRRVWWKCSQGHEYQTVISSRTIKGSDCPYCKGRKVFAGFNDLATVEPQIARQWHPTLNGKLTPQMVLPGAHKKVWWQCPGGHVWQAVVYSRTGNQKCGCPVCAGNVRKSGYVELAMPNNMGV